MKRLKTLLHSGLIGISIGMICLAVKVLLSLNNQRIGIEKAQLSFISILIWLVVSFLIGLSFNLSSWIFDNDKWSLREQIIINFFVCFVAWILFYFLLNDLSYTWQSFGIAVLNFVVVYVIAYGRYLYNLWLDIKHINEQLKKKGWSICLIF